MSEYQFYEFRSLDRPLTTKEQQEIGQWSSRAYPTATGVTLTYNYGDFPRDPKQVVAKYFDAMFYIANWGTTWLMFRFPATLLDREAIQQYCSVDEISLVEYGNYAVLEMLFSEEEGYGWIDGEGILSSLIGLRQDILHGDYRSLYLAWLYACSLYRGLDGFDLDMPEPSLSRPLTPLNEALKSWSELLRIDRNLLAAVSHNQEAIVEPSSQDLAAHIPLLSNREKDDFLLRLFQEEPLLSISLRKRLLKESQSSVKDSRPASCRTIGDIFHEAEQLAQQRQKAEKRKREEERQQKLMKLEAEEATLWENVMQYIAEKKPSAYDAAVAILQDLLLLAKHKGTQAAYEQRVLSILQEYPRLSSLKSKITRAKLLHSSK